MKDGHGLGPIEEKGGKWTWSHWVDIGVKLKVLMSSIGMQNIMRIGEGVSELLAIIRVKFG